MSSRPLPMLRHLIQVPPRTLFSWKQSYVHFRVGEFLPPLKDSARNHQSKGESESTGGDVTRPRLCPPHRKFPRKSTHKTGLDSYLRSGRRQDKNKERQRQGMLAHTGDEGCMLCCVAMGEHATLTAFWPRLREVSLAWRPAASCCAFRPRLWPCPSQ